MKFEGNNHYHQKSYFLGEIATWTREQEIWIDISRCYCDVKQVLTPSEWICKYQSKVKYSKVNAAICIAHRDEHVSNALPLPVNRCWSPLAIHQPGIQRTLRYHGHGLVCHAICLFTSPAFAGYSLQPAQRTGSGWFRAEVVYPSKDGHPPRH